MSNIIDLIPFDRYITRQELRNATGMKDRQIRREIQIARSSSPENIIISSSGNKGYKRPRTREELEKCRNESIARIKAEKKKIEAIDILLENRDQRGLGI